MNIMDILEMKAKYGTLLDEQLRLEDHYNNLAKTVMDKAIKNSLANGTASSLTVGQKLVSHGFEDARAVVEEWFNGTMKPKKGSKPAFVKILEDLQDIYSVTKKGVTIEKREDLLNMLTIIPLTCLIDNLGHENDLGTIFILSNVAQFVGKEIEEEGKIESFIKTIPPHKITGLISGISDRVDRHYKVAYARQVMVKEGFTWSTWNRKDIIHLSMQLLEIVITGSGFFELQTSQNVEGIKDIQTHVTPTEWLLKAWRENTDRLLQHATRNAPMVIPPLPWTGINSGGYAGALHGRHYLLRCSDWKGSSIYSKEYINRLNEVDLTKVQNAVNAIQETPWRINKRIFRVIKEIMATGGNLGGIPQLEKLDQLPDLTGEFTPEELKAHKKEKWEIYKKDNERCSIALRSTSHFKIASDYEQYEKIYFPYNMDFRGRVYPISAFSPQSDDLNKSLLEFAESPACETMEDIEWLMVHGANVAGVDKVSFADRKQWVLDNEAHILKSAQDPIGYQWWTTKDDASFQLLAFCFEWADWKRHEAEFKSPKGYICSIPIAFDGTCSGLQHYSAILRDTVGGKAVNLIPNDSPNDIYRVVADKVKVALEDDVKHGTEDTEVSYDDEETGETTTTLKLGTKTLAQQWLAFGVTRSVTKRSVMTLPYGSREFGFRAQIREDVIDKACKEGKGGMFIHKAQSAKYMAKHIWDVVQTVVVKAMEAMKYLQKLSKVVCKEGRVITWTTPMGLPVQQSYMEETTERIQLRLAGGVRRKIFMSSSTGNIDKHAQANGIAPNFIHSMDASHLQLTVLNAYTEQIRHFALIHDSFGCPASQASKLFRIVRESFRELYENHDVLQDFTDELSVYVKDVSKDLPDMPSKGKLDLKCVLESQYMFA